MLKKQSLLSGIWSYINNIFTGLTLTILVLIFSRLLNVEEYGLFVLASLIIDYLSKLVENIVAPFVIQSKKINSNEFSTLFYLTICFSVSLIFLIIIISPFFKQYNSDYEISYILRILSINILTKNLIALINSKFFKEFNNELVAKISIKSVFISFFVGIVLVFSTKPLEALILFFVLRPIIQLFLSIGFIKLNSVKLFDFNFSGEIIRFGYPLAISSLFAYLNMQAPKIFCGFFLGPYYLGLLSAGTLFIEQIHKIITSVNWSLWMPILSRIRKDTPNRFGEIYLRIRKIQCSILIPVFFLIISLRENVSEIVFPEKFTEAKEYFFILLIIGILTSMNYLFKPSLVIVGKTKVRLIYDCIRFLLYLTFLFPFQSLSIDKIIYSLLLTKLTIFVISHYYLKSIINKDFVKQIQSLITIFISSGISSFLINSFKNYVNLKNNILNLSILFSLGLIIYTTLIILVDKELIYEFKYIRKTIFDSKKFKSII